MRCSHVAPINADVKATNSPTSTTRANRLPLHYFIKRLRNVVLPYQQYNGENRPPEHRLC